MLIKTGGLKLCRAVPLKDNYKIDYFKITGKTPKGVINAASGFLWPNNEVPYVLDAAFATADRAVLAGVTINQYTHRWCRVLLGLNF